MLNMMDFWTGLGVGMVLAGIPAAIVATQVVRRVRRLSNRAVQAERLAKLGTLTGGLAHEIKNPLSTIGLNIQLLQEDLNEVIKQAPPGSLPEDRVGRLQRRFDSLSRETLRLRNILDDFLRFAGRLKLDRLPVDLNQIVSELADFFSPQVQAANIRLRLELSPTPVIAWVDPEMLKQALLNLLLNATHAMTHAQEKKVPHGGASDMILRTERPRLASGSEARIHIIDTGPGIPANQLDKIFQPYFSTKKQGTGLGLPTTRRIIEEHGGTVTVHSELGKGTDFVLSLPTRQPEKSAAESSEATA